MQIKDAIAYAAQKFLEFGIESAYLDARILLMNSINRPLEYLFSNSEEELSENNLTNFLKMVNKRMKLEPISYIIGYKEFYGYKFSVNDKVLIPRPDTEILIDAALGLVDHSKNANILDIGTGSGCIVITLLLIIPCLKAIAVDISDDAMKIAAINANAHSVEDRIEFIKSHWFTNVPKQKFDLIVSNPPYISNDEKILMAHETLLYEPSEALFASENGLSNYYIIAKYAKKFLKPEGKLLIEVGFTQAEQVIKIFTEAGYEIYRTYTDLSGNVRIISLILCSKPIRSYSA